MKYLKNAVHSMKELPVSLRAAPVSYTHLDVYKRQTMGLCGTGAAGEIPGSAGGSFPDGSVSGDRQKASGG